MNAPKFLSGKSLKPYFLGDRNQIRNEALTELRVWTPTGHAQGYSIKSRDYRFTKWIHNGFLDSELYDLKFDSAELNNLSKDISYQKIKDSLLQVINKRMLKLIHILKVWVDKLKMQFLLTKINLNEKLLKYYFLLSLYFLV